MKTFQFQAAIAVRAFGTISVKAESTEEAEALIQQSRFDMAKHFTPNGNGDDDFDFNYHKPAVYLESVCIDGAKEVEINKDLPDPKEGL